MTQMIYYVVGVVFVRLHPVNINLQHKFPRQGTTPQHKISNLDLTTRLIRQLQKPEMQSETPVIAVRGYLAYIYYH